MSSMNLMMTIGATTSASFHHAFDHVNQSMDRISDLQGKFGQAFAMSSAGLAGFSAPLVGMAKSAIDFESSMAEVNKTVGFDGKESLNAFGNELKTLSTQIPLSVNELASITAAGGQLGVAKENLLGFTRDISKISVAFDMSAEQAGESMGTLSNAMGIPITKISEIGDTVNAVSNNSASKARDIVSALQRVGGIAKQVKLSANDTVALTSSFIAMGQAPEVASTATEAFLRKLKMVDPANKKQAGVFKQMGLDIREFKTLMDTDAQQAINLFLSSMSRVNDSERLGALTNFMGAEHAGSIASLSGNFDLYKKHQKLANADNKGSMDKEFATISGTTANKIKLFKNNLSLVAINIGEALIPSINQAMMALTPMIQSFTEWASANPELIVGITKVVGGLLLMGAGLSGMGFIISSIINPIKKFASAFKIIGGAIKIVRLALLANPILGFALALSLVALAIYMNWDRIKPYFIKFWNSLKSLFRTAVSVLKSVIMHFTPLGLFIKLWGVVKPYFSRLWLSLKVKVVSGINIIKNIIKNFKPLSFFITAWSAVFNYFSGLVGKFRQYGSNIIQGLIGGITAKFQALKAKISEMASLVSGVFTGKMEINSPSRLFRRFGMGISQGVAMGIADKTPTAIKASDNMAKRLAQTEYSNRVLGSQSLSGGMSAGTIHFSPTINVTVGAGSGDVSAQVQEGINASYAEFERMLEMVEANRQRRAFA